MDAQELKERIVLDEKIEFILEELGMHNIKEHDEYFSCGMPSGDNKKSTIVYKDSLHVDAYTRNITDQYGVSDIIALVTFINDTYFSESLKWICDVCGYDYYGSEIKKSRLAQWVKDMSKTSSELEDDDGRLESINESMLDYFGRYGNPLFYNDGINYETQWDFGLGYDLAYHMITIPIFDELNCLVGIKGRLFKEKVEEWEDKYLYIQPCAKSKVLFGLNRTMPYIKKKGEVIVCESEKGVMQLWSMGIKNAIAISGHILSKTQARKLTHLSVPIVLAYDQGAEIGKDGEVDPTFYPNEFNKFLPQQQVYCIYDKSKKILNKKESPMDCKEKWAILYDDYKIKVRGE
jgi:hypothetical protein